MVNKRENSLVLLLSENSFKQQTRLIVQTVLKSRQTAPRRFRRPNKFYTKPLPRLYTLNDLKKKPEKKPAFRDDKKRKIAAICLEMEVFDIQ